MKYSKDNESVAQATLDLFCSLAPKFMRGFIRSYVISIMDERLRTACGLGKPNRIATWITQVVMMLRSIVYRFVVIPKSKELRRTAYKSDQKRTMGGCPIFVPRQHVFAKTYENGYTINGLGPHPTKLRKR